VILTIVDYAETGEGLAFDPSVKGPIFVPGALKGEQIDCSIDKKLRLATVHDVLTPSKDRLAPSCAHFGECGGCDWQHLTVEAQQQARIALVRRALPARFRDCEISTVAAERSFGYRTRARLSWNAANADTDKVSLGHRARRTNTVINATECPILHPVLELALSTLRDALARIGGKGTVFLSKSARGPVATLRAEKSLSVEGYQVPDWLVARGFAGVELYSPGATVAVKAGDSAPEMLAVDGLPLRMSPEGFAQANDETNRALVAHVVEHARCENKRVLELFAGAGNFTVALAPRATSVITVESDAAAVRAQQENLRVRGITNVTARVDTAISALQSKADRAVLVMDPPRTGAFEESKLIAAVPPKRMVYVSCDPATFGRDLDVLATTLTLERLTVFAMFPQTAHSEIVGVFSRKSNVGVGR
jgi:23S rRNA (uracil1939-C5)-methyltransferase